MLLTDRVCPDLHNNDAYKHMGHCVRPFHLIIPFRPIILFQPDLFRPKHRRAERQAKWMCGSIRLQKERERERESIEYDRMRRVCLNSINRSNKRILAMLSYMTLYGYFYFGRGLNFYGKISPSRRTIPGRIVHGRFYIFRFG